MFNLGVFRHRLFETSFKLYQPTHKKHTGKIGDGRYFCVVGNSGGWYVGKGGTIKQCQKAMGIDWMVRKELTQAIPPAYTEFIGRQILTLL